jgi:hypothetical protein
VHGYRDKKYTHFLELWLKSCGWVTQKVINYDKKDNNTEKGPARGAGAKKVGGARGRGPLAREGSGGGGPGRRREAQKTQKSIKRAKPGSTYSRGVGARGAGAQIIAALSAPHKNYNKKRKTILAREGFFSPQGLFSHAKRQSYAKRLFGGAANNTPHAVVQLKAGNYESPTNLMWSCELVMTLYQNVSRI